MHDNDVSICYGRFSHTRIDGIWPSGVGHGESRLNELYFEIGVFCGKFAQMGKGNFSPTKGANQIPQQLLTVVRLIIRQSSGQQTINYILLKSHCGKSANINNFRHFTVFFGRPERWLRTIYRSPSTERSPTIFSFRIFATALQHYQWPLPLAMEIPVEILAHILYLPFSRFASRQPCYPAVFPFT